MLHVALRTARSSVLTARTVRPSLALRAISSSAIRRSDDHHAAAPSIYGVGAKPGEIPTDGSQSTGLDRVQVLGLLEGVDVFDLEPLDSSRIGTLADPIKVFSADSQRIVGCTGSPAESHDVLWFTVTTKKTTRCTECGSGASLFVFCLSVCSDLFVAYAIEFAPEAQVVTEIAPQEPADSHAHAH
ncbi:Cytochrome c oxidase subunit Vb domain containing protein [Lactarius tabidus]